MIRKLSLSILLCLFCISFSFGQKVDKNTIEIEAKVVTIGNRPTIKSGARRIVYQLVKYEVMKVLSSKYSDKFILVDHIVLFDTDEVTKLKEGDRLRLELYRKDKIAVVTRENGIREESENPKTFTVREELFQLGKIKLEKVSKTPLFETNL